MEIDGSFRPHKGHSSSTRTSHYKGEEMKDLTLLGSLFPPKEQHHLPKYLKGADNCYIRGTPEERPHLPK